MKNKQIRKSNRYVNDLRRIGYSGAQVTSVRSGFLPISISLIFIVCAGIFGNMSLSVTSEEIIILIMQYHQLRRKKLNFFMKKIQVE